MTTLTTQLVDIGLNPNDGTGTNIRDAFNKHNQNIMSISDFLLTGPTLPSANIAGQLTANTIIVNSGTFSNSVYITSDTISSSPQTGSLVTNGGIGVAGNINVGGHLIGSIDSDNIISSTLLVTSSTVLAGNVQTASLTANTLDVASNVTINGTLTVFGNVITITSSELIIEHPTIEVGGVNNMQLSYNDGLNRGIDIFWYDTVANVQQQGFFGLQNSSSEFVFTPTLTSGPGNAIFNKVTANVSSIGHSYFTDISTNTINATDGFTGVLQTNAQPNINTVGILSNLAISNGNVQVSDGNINVTSGAIYINGLAVATSDSAFQGGTIPLDTVFTSPTSSTSSSSGAVIISGGLGVEGNLNIGGTLSTTSFSANSLIGTLLTNAQPNIESIGTLGNLSVTNAISAYSLGINNISAANFINASTLSASTGISGQLTTGAQPNITSVGTLSSLQVTGNITANNLISDVIGNVTGNVTGTAAVVTSNAQPNITSVGTLTSLQVTGNANVGSIDANNGLIQTTGNISTSSNLVGSFVYGTMKTSIQPNITSIGTLTSLSVSGLSTLIGNTTIGGSLLATGAGSQCIGTTTNRFGTVYSSSINNSGAIIASSFVGAHDGIIGNTNPAQGTFTTINSTGNVSLLGTAGIKYADGTFQTTAYQTGVGSFTALNVTGNINLLNSGVLKFQDGTTQNTAAITTTQSSNNVADSLVLRDASGNFFANTITSNSFVGSGANLINIPNSALTNNSITINAGTGLTGGGNISLGGTANITLSNVGTAISNQLAKITTDAQGRVTNSSTVTASDLTVILGANAVASTNAITITDDTTTNYAVYPTWVSGISGSQGEKVSSTKLTFVPNTGVLTSTVFDGAFQGNGANITGIPISALTTSSLTIGSTSIAIGGNTQTLANLITISASDTITAGTFSGSGANLTNIPVSALANSAITVAAGNGLTGGGNVSLGGYTSLGLPTVGTSVTNQLVKITTDIYGRVSSTTSVTASDIVTLIGTTTITNATNSTNSTNAANLSITDDTTSEGAVYPTWVSGVSGYQPEKVSSSKLTFVPNTGVLTATTFSGDHSGSGANLTSIPNSALVNSSITINTGDGLSGGNIISLGGNITITNTGVTQLNYSNHITTTSSTGNITIGTDATPSNTTNAIVSRDANGDFVARYINATATNAQYADLAEKYKSDGQYEPGTVLVFGGMYEVTTTGHLADVSVAGVVSTNPAYLMNSAETHAVAVALRGKVPVKFMGPVRKGDLLVTSAIPGHAESVGKDSKFGVAVFAKSLEENLAPGPKVINAVIL